MEIHYPSGFLHLKGASTPMKRKTIILLAIIAALIILATSWFLLDDDEFEQHLGGDQQMRGMQ